MHSGGLKLKKLTYYTRLEDNLMHRRSDLRMHIWAYGFYFVPGMCSTSSIPTWLVPDPNPARGLYAQT